MFELGSAIWRYAQLSGGAMDQGGPQSLLQSRNSGTDCGRRHATTRRGPREALRLNDFDEDINSVQYHGGATSIIPFMGITASIFPSSGKAGFDHMLGTNQTPKQQTKMGGYSMPSSKTLRTYYISHGGGPWPWALKMRDTFANLEHALKAMVAEWTHRPRRS